MAERTPEPDVLVVAAIFMARFDDESMHQAWLTSIRVFLDAMPLHYVVEAMGIAVDVTPKDREITFGYFRGLCWNKIKRSGEAR